MPSDPRDYRLDLGESEARSTTGTSAAPATRRPFVSVLFRCCNVYQRVYRSTDGTQYAGRCPRCGAPVRLRVGPGGTDARFFTAG